ncbi:MAG: hypothetical protein K0R68_155 [Mycobacterium sp.]|jgi:hypothetical protein|nr:hypothetical protein [Mycobacterium sp.]
MSEYMQHTVGAAYWTGLSTTAILLRWLTDPSSRNFDACDLVVVTAHTGNVFR